MNNSLPEEIKIELLHNCNLNCFFCFQKDNRIDLKLPKKNLFNALDDISESGIKAVRFTGGEVFLRDDLLDIVKYAKEKGLYVILNTNGTLINKDNICVFNFVDLVLIPINSCNAEQDFFSTGLKDSFERKLNALNSLKDFNIRIECCTIATKQNIKYLEEFYKLMSDLKPFVWFLLRPAPTLTNLRPMDNYDVEILIEKMLRLNKEYKINCFIANALPFCSYDPEKIRLVCVGGRNDDGRTRLVINPKGNIKPCYFSNIILGNIKENRILDALNSDFIKGIRNLIIVPKECNTCQYLETCHGGLRHSAKLINGSYYALDPLAQPEGILA